MFFRQYKNLFGGFLFSPYFSFFLPHKKFLFGKNMTKGLFYKKVVISNEK